MSDLLSLGASLKADENVERLERLEKIIEELEERIDTLERDLYRTPEDDEE